MLRQFLESRAVGRPQFAAAGLLLVYLLQCLWLIHVEVRGHDAPDSGQELRVYFGMKQWRDGTVAGTPESLTSEAITGMPLTGMPGHRVKDGFDEDHSPFYYLIAASPFLLLPQSWHPPLPVWKILADLPYLFFGVMLGASLWYVARRLYGNAGGFIALVLYCFSPAMIANTAGWGHAGEMGAVWGAFGAIFTAIAVAHTLYAPREVVLWNWRRIVLLGLSLALSTGNQFSLGIMVPVALLFMLWVAPVRRRAVFAIWGASVGLAALILFASYFFSPSLFWQGMRHARWIDIAPNAFFVPVSYARLWHAIVPGSPPLLLAIPAAAITFLLWRRGRYFGNAAPLLMAALLLLMGIGSPQAPGAVCFVAALTLLFVFVAGVFADLLETRYQMFVAASLAGLLLASAVWNLLQLARAG